MGHGCLPGVMDACMGEVQPGPQMHLRFLMDGDESITTQQGSESVCQSH